jgi:putative membrane protein
MKIKKAVMIIIAAVLIISIMPSAAFAAGTKNETVYALLNNDGSVNKIYVVNQLSGEYTDYGNYTDIINLSTTSKPSVEGDKITFPDTDVAGGLYYQGTTNGELPYVFSVKYYLDGKQVETANLDGAGGHLKLELRGGANTACADNVREGYMAQISLALKQNLAENINAPGATTVVAGNTMNISYTILPGNSGVYALEADVHDFEMDGITITLLKGTISGFEDTIDETKSGFDDMADGASDMVDGTTELKDGVKSLVGGIYKLKSGINTIASSGSDILSGMNTYYGGLKSYADGVDSMAAASENIASGLNSLASNAESVEGGVSDINGALKSFASNKDLKNLAQSLASSSDPSVQALAQGTLQTLGALGSISDGLDQASDGVSNFASGVQKIASQYKAFNSGLKSISSGSQQLIGGFGSIIDGFKAYLGGIKKSSSGMNSLYSSFKKLPGSIQKLIDGQVEFKDGIMSAKDEITEKINNFVADDSPAVSFSSPDKNHPDSVQYILKTPGISKPKQQAAVESEDKHEDFISRLENLFK